LIFHSNKGSINQEKFMKKKFILVIVLLFIIVFSSIFFFIFSEDKYQNNIVIKEEIKGIKIFTPIPNETISSPLKINGIVNGDGWIGFEVQVGIVRLFDNNYNELAIGILTAVGDWMKAKIDFETELEFEIPDISDGYLVFYNENPSGEPERNKTFILPIKFK